MLKKALMVSAALGMGLGFAQQKVEIEFWSWYLSPKFDNYLKDTIKDFEAKNPGITVKWFDKQDTMVQDLIASINLGKAPDVVNLNIPDTFSAAQNGFLTDISTLTPMSELKAQFWDNPLNNFTVNGKPYGYPWYGWLNEGVMVYNSDLVKKAGYSEKTLPKTNDQLLAFAKRVKDRTGQYGWIPNFIDASGAPLFHGFFYADGLPIYDEKSGKAQFNTSKHVALLKKYVDMYKQGYFPEDMLRKEAFQLSMELYNQGKLASIVGGPQALTRIKDANKDLYGKTKVAAAPLGKSGRSTGGGMDLVIPAASKHKKEAAQFAEFLSNNVNQMKFAKIVAIVPTSKGAEKDPFFKQESNDPIIQASGMVGASGRFIDPGFNPPKNSSVLYKNLVDNLEAAFLGKKTPKQALDDAAAFWNANVNK